MAIARNVTLSQPRTAAAEPWAFTLKPKIDRALKLAAIVASLRLLRG
jgi:hypothetical protein